MQKLAQRVEAGMLSINHYGLALPEVPFGGMKETPATAPKAGPRRSNRISSPGS